MSAHRRKSPGRRSPTRVALLVMVVGLLAGLAGVAGPSVGPVATAHAQEPSGEGKLLLVLDASLSMEDDLDGGQTKIHAARQALHSAVDVLPDNAQVGMRVFGATRNSSHDPKNAACTDSQLVVPIGTGNNAQLKQAIDAYQPFGDTPIAHALKQAAKDVGAEGKRSILLVSDGEETCVPDPCEVAQQIADDGIDLQINTIGFNVDDKARRQLQCIAEHGNGTYYDADDAEDLTHSLTGLSERAFRPFQFSGAPLTLTRSREEAMSADPIGPGQYRTDSDTGGVDQYVVVEKKAGSSLWVSAASRAPFDANLPSLTVELSTIPEGRSCGDEWTARPHVFSSDVLIDPEGGGWVPTNEICAEADRLMLMIRNGWDEETRTESGEPYTFPIELLIAEEGAVADTESLPPADEEVTENELVTGPLPEIMKTEPKEVTGGLAFTDAARLESGNLYRDQIVPGESLAYKVNVDFGQRAQWAVEFQDLPENSRFDWPGVQLSVWMYNPARHDFLQTKADFEGDEVVDWWRGTHEIRYRNRESRHSRLSSLAGDYYIIVTAEHDDLTVPITFDLAVAVLDEPSGHPDYAPTSVSANGAPFADSGLPHSDVEVPSSALESGGDEAGGDESGGDAGPDAEETATGESTADDLAAVALPAGLGAIVLLAVIFAILLLRRPRRNVQEPHPPHRPYPPHDPPPGR